MKAFCVLWFLLLAGLPAFAAETPPAAPAGGGVCTRSLQDLGRVDLVPADSSLRLRRVRATIAQLQGLIQAAENATASQPISQPSGTSPSGATTGGLRWHYDSAAAPGTEGGPSHANGQLVDRIGALARFLESGAPEASFFELDDPKAIHDFLWTGKHIRDPEVVEAERLAKQKKQDEARAKQQAEEREQREKLERQREALKKKRKKWGMACLWVGGSLGAFGAMIPTFHQHPNQALDQQIVDRAKETLVMDRKKHLELVKLAVKDRYNKEELIRQHIAYLDAQEKAGKKPQYGARFSEYMGMNGLADVDDLNKLAMGDRAPLTPETLENEFNSGSIDYRFTSDELRERKEKGKVNERFATFLAIGGTAGGYAAGAGAGFLACSRLGRMPRPVVPSHSAAAPAELPVVESPSDSAVPAELGEFRDIVGAVLNPDFQARIRSPREVLWLGTDDWGGKHRDLVLVIDNTVSPPRIKLTGLDYRIPVTEKKPERPKRASKPVIPAEVRPATAPLPVPAPILLSDLLNKLVNVHFHRQYGDELKPVENLFALAGNIAPQPEDLRRVRVEIDRLVAMKEISPNDLKGLERLLLQIRDRQPR